MIFLVELGVHDGVSASTIYVDTDGTTSGPTDTPANQYYMPRLKPGFSIERHMFSGGDGISGGTLSGQSSVGYGNLSVINGTPYGGPELIDNWKDLAFRTVTIKSLANSSQEFGQAVTRYIGKVAQLVSTNALNGFDVGLYDRRDDLDKPLLTSAYLGTTTSGGQFTIEGNTDLKDKIKQKVWGKKNNVECIQVNAFDLAYQSSDGPVNSQTVYDGAVALINDGNVGSVAAMFAATILAGHYLTCNSSGVFRLGAKAIKAVTADVVEGVTAADRTRAQIAKRMMAWHQANYPGITCTLAPADVTALDVLSSAEHGIVVKDTETALSSITRVLSGAWMLPQSNSSSVFNLGRFDAPSGTAVKSYDLDDNIGGDPERIETGDDGKGIPAYKVVVKGDQLDIVQTGDEIFGVVADTNPTRVAYLGQEWRQAIAQDTAVLTQFPNAPVITVETCMVNPADLATEAARVLALYKVKRDMYRIRVPMSDTIVVDPGVGEVIELTSRNGRMGLGAEPGSGKLHRVVGKVDDFADLPTLTLEAWG